MSARRFTTAPVALLLAGFVLTGLSACKDPDPVAIVPTLNTPLPPYPAWARPMIGQNMGHVLTGHGACVGVWDAVPAKHIVKPTGSEAQGWGWDVAGKTPVAHILFVNADNIIVGAGDGGMPRADVAQARTDVTSPNTGWHGVIGATEGKMLAVGVTTKNAGCNLGQYDLSATANS
jgi:hypothetical protein